MKKRLLPISAACLFALAYPAISEESASPSPSPTAAAVTTSPTPAKVAPSSAADAPANPSTNVPSPVSETTSTSEATANVVASPTPAPSPAASPAAKPDTEFLPEPTDASLGAPAEAPLPSNDVSPNDVPNPDNLLPEGTPSADESIPPAPPVIQENKYEQDRRLQIRYQEVKLLALKEAAIREMREKAEAAKTDEGKRQALREYYRLLFAKMVSIDSSIKAKCDVMQQAYLRRLGQYRVEPTIPLHPPPTPEPLAVVEAAASPTPKKR